MVSRDGSSETSGAMIALKVPPGTASRIALPDGLPPGDLHVTLAYLGSAQDIPVVQRDLIREAVQETANSSYPLEGNIPAGSGTFNNPEEQPYWYHPGTPGIDTLRDSLMRSLQTRGVDDLVVSNHEFNPHVTMAYLDTEERPPTDDQVPDPEPVVWTDLIFCLGDDEETYPLGGSAYVSPDDNTDPILEEDLQPSPEPTLQAAARPQVQRFAVNSQIEQSLRRRVETHNRSATLGTRTSLEAVKAVFLRGAAMAGSKGHQAATRTTSGTSRVDQFLADLSTRHALGVDADLYPDEPHFTRLAVATRMARRHGHDQVHELLLASAALPPDDPRRTFNLNRALAMILSGGTPMVRATLGKELRNLVADGNSSLARSLRARRQLRDRHGRWIEMGGGIRFKIRHPGSPGGGTWYHGTVVSQDVPKGEVGVKLDNGQLVGVPANKVEQPIAILHEDANGNFIPSPTNAQEDAHAPFAEMTPIDSTHGSQGAYGSGHELNAAINQSGSNLAKSIKTTSPAVDSALQVRGVVAKASSDYSKGHISGTEFRNRLADASAFSDSKSQDASLSGSERKAFADHAESLQDIIASVDPHSQPSHHEATLPSPTPEPDLPALSDFTNLYDEVKALHKEMQPGDARDQVGAIGNAIGNTGQKFLTGHIDAQQALGYLNAISDRINVVLADHLDSLPGHGEAHLEDVQTSVHDLHKQIDAWNNIPDTPSEHTPESAPSEPDATPAPAPATHDPTNDLPPAGETDQFGNEIPHGFSKVNETTLPNGKTIEKYRATDTPLSGFSVKVGENKKTGEPVYAVYNQSVALASFKDFHSAAAALKKAEDNYKATKAVQQDKNSDVKAQGDAAAAAEAAKQADLAAKGIDDLGRKIPDGWTRKIGADGQPVFTGPGRYTAVHDSGNGDLVLLHRGEDNAFSTVAMNLKDWSSLEAVREKDSGQRSVELRDTLGNWLTGHGYSPETVNGMKNAVSHWNAIDFISSDPAYNKMLQLVGEGQQADHPSAAEKSAMLAHDELNHLANQLADLPAAPEATLAPAPTGSVDHTILTTIAPYAHLSLGSTTLGDWIKNSIDDYHQGVTDFNGLVEDLKYVSGDLHNLFQSYDEVSYQDAGNAVSHLATNLPAMHPNEAHTDTPNPSPIEVPAAPTPNPPAAPTPAPASVPDDQKFEILPKDKRGKSGEKYHPSGPYGKYGASGILVRAKDDQGQERFLIVQRGTGLSHNHGKWQFPGGALEELESPHQGAAREFTEEVNGAADQLDKLSTHSTSVLDPGKGWKYTTILADLPKIFKAGPVPGTEWEIADAKWVTAAQLSDMSHTGQLLPALAPQVDGLLAQFGSSPNAPETPDVPSAHEAPNVPEASTASKGPDLGSVKFDISGWKQISGQGEGANSGGVYEAPDGTQYYVKASQSDAQAHNEVLASHLYTEAGIEFPEVSLATNGPNGKLMIASKMMPGATNDLEAHYGDKAYLEKLYPGFVIDAWLANWDAAGTYFTNIVTKQDGNPSRLDAGGALLFRGLQGLKGKLFGNKVGEIETLRDPKLNKIGAKTFGGISDEQMRDSAKNLLNVSESRIDELINSTGLSQDQKDELSTKLKARRNDLLSRFHITQEDNKTPAATPTPVQVAKKVEAAFEPSAPKTPGDATKVRLAADGTTQLEIGMKVKSIKDGSTGTVVKHDPSDKYVKVKMDDTGKTLARATKTLMPVGEPAATTPDTTNDVPEITAPEPSANGVLMPNGTLPEGTVTVATEPDYWETKSLHAYTITAYEDINDSLRTGNTPSLENQGHIDNLDKLMQASTLNEPITAWRGISTDDGSQLLDAFTTPGNVLADDGYSSLTASKATASTFAGVGFAHYGDETSLMLQMTVPAGTHLLDVESQLKKMTFPPIGTEQELLLARGTQFSIDSATFDPNTNVWHVKATVLPQEAGGHNDQGSGPGAPAESQPGVPEASGDTGKSVPGGQAGGEAPGVAGPGEDTATGVAPTLTGFWVGGKNLAIGDTVYRLVPGSNGWVPFEVVGHSVKSGVPGVQLEAPSGSQGWTGFNGNLITADVYDMLNNKAAPDGFKFPVFYKDGSSMAVGDTVAYNPSGGDNPEIYKIVGYETFAGQISPTVESQNGSTFPLQSGHIPYLTKVENAPEASAPEPVTLSLGQGFANLKPGAVPLFKNKWGSGYIVQNPDGSLEMYHSGDNKVSPAFSQKVSSYENSATWFPFQVPTQAPPVGEPLADWEKELLGYSDPTPSTPDVTPVLDSKYGEPQLPAGSKIVLQTETGSILVEHPDSSLAIHRPTGTVIHKPAGDLPGYQSSQVWHPWDGKTGLAPDAAPKTTAPESSPAPAAPLELHHSYSPAPAGSKILMQNVTTESLLVQHPDGKVYLHAHDHAAPYDVTDSLSSYKVHKAWKNWDGQTGLASTPPMPTPPPPPEPSGPPEGTPGIMGMNGQMIYKHSEVVDQFGNKGIVKSLESNGQYAKVYFPATGKTMARSRKKLTVTGYTGPTGGKSSASSIHVPSTPHTPTSFPTPAPSPFVPDDPAEHLVPGNPDPSSPWYGLDKPTPPEPPSAAMAKVVDDNWLAEADKNYALRMQAKGQAVKPLAQSSTYNQFLAVQKGDVSSLNQLLSQNRITKELHDSAMAQINANTAKIKVINDAYQGELSKYHNDLLSWSAANGTPAIKLKGMDEGVHKWNNNQAWTWMWQNMKPGIFGPGGKLSSAARSAVASQKGSSAWQTQLRKVLRKDSLDPAKIDAYTYGATVKAMDQAMLESPQVPEDFIAIRTFATDAFVDPNTGHAFGNSVAPSGLSHIVGTVQHDWGFAEMSPGSLEKGATPGLNMGDVTMEIRVPKGTRGVWTAGSHGGGTGAIGGHQYERGFIVERGIGYYIHSVEWTGHNWNVKAEIIPKGVNYDDFNHFIGGPAPIFVQPGGNVPSAPVADVAGKALDPGTPGLAPNPNAAPVDPATGGPVDWPTIPG